MAEFRASTPAWLHRAWSRVDVYAWILLFPALMIGIALWERPRNVETLRLYSAAVQGLPHTVAELHRIEARDPTATIAKWNGREQEFVSPALAAVAAEQAIPVAERGVWLSHVRAPLPRIAMAGGLLALLSGGAGLLIAARAGAIARRSRSHLIDSFSRVHRILPFLLGGVVVGLACAIVAICLFEAIGAWFWSRNGDVDPRIFLIAAMFGGAAVYGAFLALRGLRDILALNTSETFEESGRIVGESEAPGLWQVVRYLAEQQKALVPDAIVVGLDGGFYVTERAMRIQPGGQLLDGRTLYLPAPYLEMMDDEELAGVIGHELAHFVGEDTSYSRHFTPIYMGLENALIAMGQATARVSSTYPAYRLGLHMFERFDHAVKHWGRLREFEADRLSSLASGPRSIAKSLMRVSVIAPVVAVALERAFAEPAGEARDLIADMLRLVHDHGWPDIADHLEDRAVHPTDTHPSTPQRIKALKLSLDDGLTAVATRPPIGPLPSPGARLFADWLGLRRALSADFQAAARQAHAAHRAHLQNRAAAVGQEEVKLYEKSAIMIGVYIFMAAIFGIPALLVAMFLANGTITDDRLTCAIFAAVIGVIGAGGLAMAVRLIRRYRTPVFVFGPDMVTVKNLSQPLRWLDIEYFQVGVRYATAVMFGLVPDAPLPNAIGALTRTRVRKKQRTISVVFYGIRGMRRADLVESFNRYLNAAHARRALEESYTGLPEGAPS